jgi:hypothetical protein
VVLAPLAAPERAGGISERITLVSCELAMPIPAPKTTNDGSSDQKVSAGEITATMAAKPTASRTSPTRTTIVVPIRGVRRPLRPSS